jgi:glyoxylase-like metal-dependent hydrolase (beta-lactamase superfamily II)
MQEITVPYRTANARNPSPSRVAVLLLVILFVTTGFQANAGDELRLEQVSEHVYAVIGPLGNRSPQNLGNNATFGFVVTDEGVVLIDSGGSLKGAAVIDELIRSVTDKPVKIVINTGGQDHRWLGNGYFKSRGARIIASQQAVEDQRARLQDQLFRLGSLVGQSGMEGTEPSYADETFEEATRFTFGELDFQLRHVGHAHTPGDIFVWLSEARIVFAGDIVFVERLLGVQEYSNSRGWIEAFDAIAELDPAIIIPGHGATASLDRARQDTRDYLLFLRESVAAYMDQGGTIERIGTLDQSRFEHLSGFDDLKGRNAQQVYQELEWE